MWVERIPEYESAQKADPVKEHSPAAAEGTRTPRPFDHESVALLLSYPCVRERERERGWRGGESEFKVCNF